MCKWKTVKSIDKKQFWNTHTKATKRSQRRNYTLTSWPHTHTHTHDIEIAFPAADKNTTTKRRRHYQSRMIMMNDVFIMRYALKLYRCVNLYLFDEPLYLLLFLGLGRRGCYTWVSSRCVCVIVGRVCLVCVMSVKCSLHVLCLHRMNNKCDW